jgi:hypothetical protein
MDDAATPHKDGYGILKVRAGCSRTDIEQSVLFPVVGGGWITRARKIPIPGRSASIGLPARKGIGDLEQPNPGRGAAPGQHVSHPDALNALGAN